MSQAVRAASIAATPSRSRGWVGPSRTSRIGGGPDPEGTGQTGAQALAPARFARAAQGIRRMKPEADHEARGGTHS